MSETPTPSRREHLIYFLQVGLNLILLALGFGSWWMRDSLLGLFVALCGAVGLVSAMLLRSLRERSRRDLRQRRRGEKPNDRT